MIILPSIILRKSLMIILARRLPAAMRSFVRELWAGRVLIVL